MSHFDLFTAQAMLYFAAVSFAEASQRLQPDDSVSWSGFLGVGDPVLERIPTESLMRLRALTVSGRVLHSADRELFVEWITRAIAPRNVAGLFRTASHNLYPVDFDALVRAHQLLGMSSDEVVARLPSLRGMSPAPTFDSSRVPSAHDLATARR
jgi:hypothetical protein